MTRTRTALLTFLLSGPMLLNVTPASASPTLPAPAGNGSAALHNPQTTTTALRSADQAASVPRYRTARVDGFRGDSVLLRVDYRTNPGRTSSPADDTVRVIRIDGTPVYSDSDERDVVKGNVSATVRVLTRAGVERANLARTNLPDMYVLGTLIGGGQGAVVEVRLDGRGVSRTVTLAL